MSPRVDNAKHSAQKPKKETRGLDQILIVRLLVAAVLLIVSQIVKMPTAARVALIILSIAASAYDLALDAIDAVLDGDYFSDPLLILLIAILSVPFGYGAEGAALALIYQISRLLFDVIAKLTRNSGRQLLSRLDEETTQKVEETLKSRAAVTLPMEDEVRKSATLVLRVAMGAALVYAIVLPLISGFTYRVSIHRALMMLAACIPGSVVAAMPLTALVGLCCAAGKGLIFNSAADMEKTAQVNVVVFDKAGVFSEGQPRILQVQSAVEGLDEATFLNMAAHAAYYSEQPFAKAITAATDPEYHLDVISGFEDITGGLRLNIGDSPIVLACAETFSHLGIVVPADPNDRGQVYYMTLAGRYVGKIVFSDDINANAAALVSELKEEGVRRSMLLTEDSAGESQRVAETLGIAEVYGDCDTERKLKLIEDLSQGPRNKILFVYANGIERHSAAQVDMRLSRRAKYADVTVLPEDRENIAKAFSISRRMKDVATKNAIFVFAIKALLIFLSMIGYSKIWFVLFVDVAAAMGTMLNAIRVTQPSYLDKLLKR